MSEERFILDVIEEASAKRRTERRRFMRMAAGAGAVGGLAMLGACNNDDDNVIVVPTPTPTASATGSVTDADVLNFALQLEYLEAQFYSYAAFGTGLNSALQSGMGTQGAVAINTSATAGQPRQVTFQDPIVAQYAREIAYDEIAHVTFLRNALGSAAVAQPALNLSGDANGAFTAAARAAGVVSSTGTFDPYASDENFLLAAYIFEDVGVTAYMGGVTLLTNKTFVEAAAGIHAAEAYHAGLVRSVIYRKGLTNGTLITAANQISDARDSLDGSTDLDQGITVTTNGVTSANIVPADSNAIAFARTPGQVLNVVYLNKAAVTAGGFFPNGLNGNVRTSAASG